MNSGDWDQAVEAIERSGNGMSMFDYTHDFASNRLTRENIVAGNEDPAVHLDELYIYDGLHRLSQAKKGQLSAGAIDDPSHNQTWVLDAMGNWDYLSNAIPGSFAFQNRTHNAVNEIDTNDDHSDAPGECIAMYLLGPDWIDPVYDAAGNMTQSPKPGVESKADGTEQRYTFDAWNRLVKVEQREYTASTPGDWSDVVEYEYDGLRRRIAKYLPALGANATSTHFYFNGQQIVEERAGTFDGSAVETINTTNPYAQYVYHPSLGDTIHNYFSGVMYGVPLPGNNAVCKWRVNA